MSTKPQPSLFDDAFDAQAARAAQERREQAACVDAVYLEPGVASAEISRRTELTMERVEFLLARSDEVQQGDPHTWRPKD